MPGLEGKVITASNGIFSFIISVNKVINNYWAV